MKSSKNAHRPIHRRTDTPQLGEKTVRNWDKERRRMTTVTDRPLPKVKPVKNSRKPRRPTFGDIWPEKR